MSTSAAHLPANQPSHVKFHTYQTLQPFKQSVRRAKGQRQSVSLSEGDKVGNSSQYWLSLCTYILSTGRPEEDNTRTADFCGPFISPHTTKSINERMKDSDDFWSEENFSRYMKGLRRGSMRKAALSTAQDVFTFFKQRESSSLAEELLWGEGCHYLDTGACSTSPALRPPLAGCDRSVWTGKWQQKEITDALWVTCHVTAGSRQLCECRYTCLIPAFRWCTMGISSLQIWVFRYDGDTIFTSCRSKHGNSHV